MTRVVAEPPIQFAGFGHVVEDEHAAGDVAFAVADRRCRALDIELVAVAADQQGRAYRLDRAVAAHRDRQRVLERLAGLLVKAAEDLVDRPAAGVVDLPAGEFLGDRVDVLDIALGVGRDDAVTDRVQRDLRALLLAEQRLLVELALGDVVLDTEQAHQAAAIVLQRLGAAGHPAPFTALVLHAMDAFEEFGLAFEMFAHLLLHPRHVVRVHKPVPVGQHVFLLDVIAEHVLPAPRQLDALRVPVEIPDAVIGRQVDELIALLVLVEEIGALHALEAGRQGGADQLHEQVKISVRLVDRPFVGERKKTRDFVADREADDQRGTDAQFREAPELLARARRPRGGVLDFDDLEVAKVAAEPGPVVE